MPTLSPIVKPAVPSSPPAIEPPEDWVAHYGVSHEFVLYHPPQWAVDDVRQTGFHLTTDTARNAWITALDFRFLGTLDDADILDALEGWTVALHGIDTDTIVQVASEIRASPRPMAYLEFRWHSTAHGADAHHVAVYTVLDHGGCLIADLGVLDEDLQPDEIEAFLTLLSATHQTPEQFVQAFVYAGDVETPSRWAMYDGEKISLRHPAEWSVLTEAEYAVRLAVPDWGEATIVVTDKPVAEKDEVAILMSMASDTATNAGIELGAGGDITEPMPYSFVEAVIHEREYGATGQIIVYRVPRTEGTLIGILDRLTGPFAPEEQAAFVDVLASVVVND